MEEQVAAEAVASMDLEEERLKLFLLQLRSESGILDRMIYKNKNQHRRCTYFQSLLKVRRDTRLLLCMGLEEIVKSAFQVIHGKNPAQRVYLLERLKERHSSGKHNFQDRLLGVARLLGQMIEPILRAAIQISSLLGRSFFMSFSLTILSLLGRLRVLVQQMLVDIVSIFNTVSSLSQKKHSAKLIKNKVEAFREYYPPNGEVISLDCSWEGDKFVLLERTYISKTKELEGVVGVASPEASGVKYEKIEASDEDPAGSNSSGCNDEEHVLKEGAFALSSYNVHSPTTGVSSSSSRRLYDSSKTRKIAAFIPVNVTSETVQMTSKKIKLDDPLGSNPLDTQESKDSFFNLLTAGSMRSSIFD